MANENAGKDPMVLPALNNVVFCGMLYDGKSRNYYPGLCLISENGVKIREFRKTSSEVLTEKEFNKKQSNKNINGSLKFEIKMLSANIGGGYASSQRSSKTSEKVFFDCDISTKQEEILFDPHGKNAEKNRDLIQQTNATHIVSAIEYGGKAVFEFEMEKSEESESSDIDGKAEVGFDPSAGCSLLKMVQKLPSISAGGSLSLKNSEAKSLERTKIKLTADFVLDKMPETFEDCMVTYRKISTMVGEGKPLVVHLAPVSIFKAKNPPIIPLDQELITPALDVRQALEEHILDCKSYLDGEVAFRFKAFKNEVDSVIGLAIKWLDRFNAKGSKIMKKIECGESEEKELTDHIQNHEKSPFQSEILVKYLDMVEDWQKMLQKCHEVLFSCKKITRCRNKSEALMQGEIVVCFQLEIPKKSRFQDDMNNAIRKNKKATEEGYETQASDFDKDIEAFSKHAEESRNIRFIFYLSECRQHINYLKHVVEMYQKGNLISSPGFKLPSQITGIFAKDISNCSATITWEDFEKSTGKSFEVKIKCRKDKEEQVPQQFTIKDDQTGVCLQDLHSDTRYEAAVRLSGCSIENLTLQGEGAENLSAVWSEPLIFQTKLPKPELSELGDHRFRVTWGSNGNYTWKIEITKGKAVLLEESIKEAEFDFTLECDGTYQICLSAFNKDGSCKEQYPPIIKEIENSNQLQNLRAQLKEKSFLKTKGKPAVYLLPMEDEMIKAKRGKQIGTFRPYMEERIVLLLGTSSEGKKRWLNTLVSSLYDVKAVDNYYFAVSVETTTPGEESSYDGSGIMIYRFCQVEGCPFPYTLTIIETEVIQKEALSNGNALCKHIEGILSYLGPGFSNLDAISLVHDESNLKRFRDDVTAFYKAKTGIQDENNILFIYHDGGMGPFDLEAKLTEQYIYLQSLTGPKDTNIRRLRFRLLHACGTIQNALIQYLSTEQKQLHLVEDVELEMSIPFNEYRLETKYEELLPGVKALNCVNCACTCQPFCTEEEAADKEKCAVLSQEATEEQLSYKGTEEEEADKEKCEVLSQEATDKQSTYKCTEDDAADEEKCEVLSQEATDKQSVYMCTVCPEECEIRHHHLEQEVIVQISCVTEVQTEDIFAQCTDPSIGSYTKGAVIGIISKTLKEDEERLRMTIQNGLKIFNELHPDQSVKDFFNYLQTWISEDNKSLRGDCTLWVRNQKEDPVAMKSWGAGTKRVLFKCEQCFEMYGQKEDCLAKVKQNNFLVPFIVREMDPNTAEMLSPMRIWKQLKNELKYEGETYSSVVQAYEFQHAKVCNYGLLGDEIKATDNPRQITFKALQFPENKQWDNEKENILLEIIQAAVKDQDFKNALNETGSQHIGYLSTADKYLGTGLDRKHSQNLKHSMWTGVNKYGELLMEVRYSLQ